VAGGPGFRCFCIALQFIISGALPFNRHTLKLNVCNVQLSGGSVTDESYDARYAFTPQSWQNVLSTLELRSTDNYYQRHRRFADDDAVS